MEFGWVLLAQHGVLASKSTMMDVAARAGCVTATVSLNSQREVPEPAFSEATRRKKVDGCGS